MNHTFSVEHAVQFGIEEAILIGNFQFWLAKNRADKRNQFDGRTWTYNTASAFAELIPYFNAKQVYRLLTSLVDQGVIMKGNFNDNPRDRTHWFAFVNEAEFLPEIDLHKKSKVSDKKEAERPAGKGSVPFPESGKCNSQKREMQSSKTGTPFPENGKSLYRTDITTDVNTDNGAGAPACPTEPPSGVSPADPALADQRSLEATPSDSGVQPPRVKNKSVDYLMAKGVEYQVALDWMIARKTKAVTPTVWSLIEEEASIAGITPVAAVTWACKRGYTQFVGAWYLEQNPKTTVATASGKAGGFSKYPAKASLMDANRAAAAAYLAERNAGMAEQQTRDMGEVERAVPPQDDFFNA